MGPPLLAYDTISHVCRSWHQSLDADHPTLRRPLQLFRSVLTRQTSPRELPLSNLQMPCLAYFLNASFQAMLTQRENTQRKLPLTSYALAKREGIHAPLIQKLESLSEKERACISTLKICLSRCALDDLFVMLNSLPNLVSLSISDEDAATSKKLQDRHLLELSSLCPKLRSICLEGCRHFTHEALSVLLQRHGALLELLQLRRCSQITNEGLLGVLALFQQEEMFTELKTASLPFTLDDHAIDAFLQRCPNLTHLNLSFNNKITRATLASIATHCPNLEVLNVSNCSGLSTEDHRYFAAALEGLKALITDECPPQDAPP